jgi:hypothetical protein
MPAIGSTVSKAGCGILGLAVACLSTPAQAQLFELDEQTAPARTQSSFTDHPFTLGMRAGWGTSVGLVGLVAEYNLLEPLALGAGVGLNGPGVEFGAHLKVRPVTWKTMRGRAHAISLEGAYSRARYSSVVSSIGGFGICHGDSSDPDDLCYEAQRSTPWVNWVAADVGWETVWPSGLSLRTATGAARLASPDPGCEVQGEEAPCARGETADRWLWTVSATLAYGF